MHVLSITMAPGCLLLVRNPSNLSKIQFFHDTFDILRQHRSSQTLLFYSKQKVWIFPEILSPFPTPYDKISLLCLLAKSAKKINMWWIYGFWWIWIKMWFFRRNFNLNQKLEFLSYKDVRPGVEKLFPQTFQKKLNI